jgi:alkaline phosphatase D
MTDDHSSVDIDQMDSSVNRRTFLGASSAAAGLGFAGIDYTKAQSNSTDATPVMLTHGVASGDVTDESAVIWARTDGPAFVHVEYLLEGAETVEQATPVETTTESDYIAQVRLSRLDSASRYHYRVWATESQCEGSAAPEDAVQGLFVTAPAPDERASVRMAVSADGFDRNADPPFSLLNKIAEFRPDFFVYNGDTIYADAPTPAVPDAPADELEEFRAKHKEMRSTVTNLQNLLAVTSVYAIWDDHEVDNNFAGPHNPLTPLGKEAFMEYWPIDNTSKVTGDDPDRLYRKFRWGKNLELFIIDTRSYKDRNTVPDGPNKTLLGQEQHDWLLRSLSESSATFKVIINSFPLSFPGNDGWPSFEYELGQIIEYTVSNVDNVFWVSGDCHHAQVASYDPDEDGNVDFYEMSVGPLGGRKDTPDHPLDPTFNPTNRYAEGGLFNFGTVFVDDGGEELRFEIRDEQGAIHYSKTITAR